MASFASIWGRLGGTIRKLDLEVSLPKSSHFADRETEVQRRDRTCLRSLSIPVAPCPVGRSIYSLTPRATLFEGRSRAGHPIGKKVLEEYQIVRTGRVLAT